MLSYGNTSKQSTKKEGTNMQKGNGTVDSAMRQAPKSGKTNEHKHGDKKCSKKKKR
jgi:hypothetical protein